MGDKLISFIFGVRILVRFNRPGSGSGAVVTARLLTCAVVPVGEVRVEAMECAVGAEEMRLSGWAIYELATRGAVKTSPYI
jgi:hypothetical protein